METTASQVDDHRRKARNSRSTCHKALGSFGGSLAATLVWTALAVPALMTVSILGTDPVRARDDAAKPYVTLKLIGQKWYWRVEYKAAQASRDLIPPCGEPPSSDEEAKSLLISKLNTGPPEAERKAAEQSGIDSSTVSGVDLLSASGAPSPAESSGLRPSAKSGPFWDTHVSSGMAVPAVPVDESQSALTTEIAMDVRFKPTDPNNPGLLDVDNEVVVPVDTDVCLQVTATDGLHTLAVPDFRIRVDAVPGRVHGSWFTAKHEGVHYGQRTEPCGQEHACMPLKFRVVSESDYNAWLAQARAQHEIKN